MFSKAEQRLTLLGEENEDPVLKSSSPRRRYQLDFKRLFYLLLALNLVILVLVETGSLSAVTNISVKFRDPGSIFPSVSSHQQTFTPNNAFYKVSNADKEIAWDSLMPTAGGFVRIDDPPKHGLSGGYPLDSNDGVEAEAYCVSVFHQLHCLDSIREQLERPSQLQKRHDRVILSPHENEMHLLHCIDYLRQSIMCCGDMSLEKAVIDQDGNLLYSTNGWGGNHTCKAWNEVFDITESMNSHRKTNAN